MVALPLADRAGDPLYPRPYRWSGGDAIGSVQSAADAVAGVTYRPLTKKTVELRQGRL
jgi:hypothetical protein